MKRQKVRARTNTRERVCVCVCSQQVVTADKYSSLNCSLPLTTRPAHIFGHRGMDISTIDELQEVAWSRSICAHGSCRICVVWRVAFCQKKAKLRAARNATRRMTEAAAPAQQTQQPTNQPTNKLTKRTTHTNKPVVQITSTPRNFSTWDRNLAADWDRPLVALAPLPEMVTVAGGEEHENGGERRGDAVLL